jgi:serine/threonine protein kinase
MAPPTVLDSASALDEAKPGRSGKVTFRCPCGAEVPVDGGQQASCPHCGRVTPLKGLDLSQTVTLCSGNTSFVLSQPGDRSGQQLGHFVLEELLGQGGMGAVYRALDSSLQRYVAVKVLRTGQEESAARDVQRLLDEAVAQARLSDPNVVTVYYVGREGEEPFLAMELLPGPTLEHELKSGPLAYSDMIAVAKQVVSALRHAQRMGLIHGDIKPSNLIRSGPRQIKLGDFGLSRIGDSSENSGISGTPSYLAPELTAGGSPSRQSDMYALGVTLFELTFGRRPYQLTGATLRDRLATHQTARLEFPERWPRGIPLEWREVLERLLAKRPEDRYADYDELLTDLRRVSPVGTTLAGRFTRCLAMTVDLLLQLLLVPLFILPKPLLGMADLPQQNPVLRTLSVTLELLEYSVFFIPWFWAWIEYRGWPTPGRYLFQLRVVDEHGLRPPPRTRALRSMLRNIGIWQIALTYFPLPITTVLLAVLTTFADTIVIVIYLISALFMFMPRRRALHDLLFHTQVVLATDQTAPINPES